MLLSVDDGCSRIFRSGTSWRAGHRRFLALMVGALGCPALTPPRGPPLMFLSVDGGHSRITSSDTSQGATVDDFTLMVGAPGSPSTPVRGPAVDISLC
jgi:hypothetical protein